MKKPKNSFALAMIGSSMLIVAGLLEAGEAYTQRAVFPAVLSAILILVGFVIVFSERQFH